MFCPTVSDNGPVGRTSSQYHLQELDHISSGRSPPYSLAIEVPTEGVSPQYNGEGGGSYGQIQCVHLETSQGKIRHRRGEHLCFSKILLRVVIIWRLVKHGSEIALQTQG